tara:strand:- start:17212 stop:19929 length:2718 start_codon:yes stop_codon:yes gene_type:complete
MQDNSKTSQGQQTDVVEKDVGLCYHCGLPINISAIVRNGQSFCCQGCAGAYELIAGSGMLDYYEFRTEYAPRPEEKTNDEIWDLIESQSTGSESDPPRTRAIPTDSDTSTGNDRNIAPTSNKAGQTFPGHGTNPRAESDFLIEGIHCSSCIWLNETMLRSLPGVLEASGNLATNRLHLVWNPESISLKELAHRIEKMGYRLLPLRKSDSSEAQKNYARNLLKRMVVAGFFAGNIMLVSVSLYAGYFGVMDRFTRNFFHLVSFAFATPVMLYSAAVFFRTAWSSLKHGVLSMDLLTASGLAIAYFYSIYAAFFEAGEVYFDSVCFVTFAVLAGRYLESRLKLRSLYLIDNLQQAESPFARILENGNQRIVASESLNPGDIILLKPGESLPCDCRLLDESAEVEQSLLTGEFEPVTRKRGDLLLSGVKSIGEMKLKVERPGDQSALRQIQNMASESLNDSPRSQKFAEMAGRYFVGFVLLAGIAAFFYHYQISGLSEAIIVTVTLLIVACPCALNLAIPTAFIAGIQRSYSSGILYRNGQHLETVARARHIIFDKTGTLTSGRMEIAETYIAPDLDADTLCSISRSMESGSGIQHPVVRAFETRFAHLKQISFPPENLKYLPGKGLILRLTQELQRAVMGPMDSMDSKDSPGDFYLGSVLWLKQQALERKAGLDLEQILRKVTREGAAPQGPAEKVSQILKVCEANRQSAIALFTAKEKSIRVLAVFLLHDALRPDAKEVLSSFDSRYRLTMLSGDSREHVGKISEELGIQDFYAQQSPEQKRDFVKSASQKTETLMVGDGINDSAALASADAGISFAGGAGLALNSSDILLLNNRLGDLWKMIVIARSTRRKIIQNLILAFTYNILLLPIAFAGFISPFLGALFMSLSSITVIVNSIFAGKVKSIS